MYTTSFPIRSQERDRNHWAEHVARNNPMSQASPSVSPQSLPAVSHAQKGARTALLLLLTINMFNFLDRQVLAAVESHIELNLFPESEYPYKPGTKLGTKERVDPTIEGRMGSLNLAFMFSYMLFAPLFGWLADRMKRWLLVGIGVTLWSLASGATGLAPTFHILFLTRCLVGI